MPQLVKGGKHVYGWSVVGANGDLILPPDAAAEYGLTGSGVVTVTAGNATSGGITILALNANGTLFAGVQKAVSEMPEGECAQSRLGRIVYRIPLSQGRVRLSQELMKQFSVGPGDRLLTIRGSRCGLTFAAKGPIVNTAVAYSGLSVYE